MSCIERRTCRLFPQLGLGLAAAALLAACSNAPPPAAAVQAQPAPPAAPELAPAAPAAPAGAVREVPKLAPPKPSTSLEELRMQAALRIVAANPGRTYTGEVPSVLLAIPVLEIELFNDGRIKRINVLRKPGQALETVQLAIEAVQRAAPFGDVSHLPGPHKFVETFLFNEDLLFKPRTLD